VVGLLLAGALARWAVVGFRHAGINLPGLLAYRRYRAEFENAEPKPSDADMDRWLQGDVEYIQMRAPRRVRLNAALVADGGELVLPPQTVVGMNPRRRRIRLRRGKDNRLRANVYQVHILFLTNNLVSEYRCVLDMATGDNIHDETNEYHYRDIVGVSSRAVPMPGDLSALFETIDGFDEPLSVRHQFSLSITSGESLEVDTGYGSATQTATGQIAWGRNEHAFNLVQKMVRARHTTR
jgi:hypothetical protein